MFKATVIRAFTRSDIKARVKIGEQLVGSEDYIKELARVGLVNNVHETDEPAPQKGAPANPPEAAGKVKSLSASQAAQASAETTSKQSKSGGGKTKKAEK